MDNAPLPHWLAPTAHQQHIDNLVEPPVDPSFVPPLVPPLVPTTLLDPQERRRLSKELLDATFESMFERVLTEITCGRSLRSVLAEDLRDISYEAFWRWMKRDPRRMERYKEAQEMRAELLADEVIEIADGLNSIDPSSSDSVNRDRLRIDTRWKIMSAHNRRRYGESKQIEVSTSISITAALEQARSRVAALPVVEEVDDVDDPLALPSPDSNAD